MRRLIVSRHARLEVREAALFYLTRSAGAHRQFSHDLEKAFRLVLAFPSASPVAAAGTRKCLLSRFPYFVVYRIDAGRVRIVAFAHAKQRPYYWTARIKK